MTSRGDIACEETLEGFGIYLFFPGALSYKKMLRHVKRKHTFVERGRPSVSNDTQHVAFPCRRGRGLGPVSGFGCFRVKCAAQYLGPVFEVNKLRLLEYHKHLRQVCKAQLPDLTPQRFSNMNSLRNQRQLLTGCQRSYNNAL